RCPLCQETFRTTTGHGIRPAEEEAPRKPAAPVARKSAIAPKPAPRRSTVDEDPPQARPARRIDEVRPIDEDDEPAERDTRRRREGAGDRAERDPGRRGQASRGDDRRQRGNPALLIAGVGLILLALVGGLGVWWWARDAAPPKPSPAPVAFNPPGTNPPPFN